MKIFRTQNFVPEAVQFICNQAKEAIARNNLFRIGLCGGSTPRLVYAALAQADLPWSKVLFTFGDERMVPPEDDQSNYKMAKAALFDPAQAPTENILRMEGELAPEIAALNYEQRLAKIATRFSEERYVHDLLLLGVGDDGHTASLFPETTALKETARNVVSNFVPKFDTHRITFTYPLINAARQILFMVNDRKKDQVIEEILSGTSSFPAAKVKPQNGELNWLLGQ